MEDKVIKVGDLVKDTQTYIHAQQQALGVVIKIMESRVGVTGVCVQWSDAPSTPPCGIRCAAWRK